jgi:hypothetical protein
MEAVARWGRMAAALAASAAMAIAPACGGDDDDATSAGSSSPADEAGWCDEMAAIFESGDIPSNAVASAPDELEADLEALARASDVDPEAAPEGTLAGLLESQAAVEAWGHEQCGTDHPFCSLWNGYSGVIAGSTFAEADHEVDQQDVAAELERVVGEMDDVLLAHVPEEVRGDLQTFTESMRAVLDDPDLRMTDAEERAAEEAEDALDAWAVREGCEGATKHLAE